MTGTAGASRWFLLGRLEQKKVMLDAALVAASLLPSCQFPLQALSL